MGSLEGSRKLFQLIKESLIHSCPYIQPISGWVPLCQPWLGFPSKSELTLLWPLCPTLAASGKVHVVTAGRDPGPPSPSTDHPLPWKGQFSFTAFPCILGPADLSGLFCNPRQGLLFFCPGPLLQPLAEAHSPSCGCTCHPAGSLSTLPVHSAG